ncbi:MAG: tetratricopeptide repeat protein [Candidatus Heimdallarchaeota archaeon]|nr:tetratricopeptide repeat protein [Candidatus Heimdallarchaeota archaeon]
MGLPTVLGQLIDEIASSDFQLTEELANRISDTTAVFQDNPEKLIEINMIVGVQLGRKGEYAHADEYFMACWPHAHRLNREEGMYAWPWGEEKVNPVDTLERIDLYQFIQPFYEVIEPKEYFAFLEFQLRCQEVVGMIRKGEYAGANERLLGLFDHLPRSVHVKNEVLSELRKEFREQRKLDLQVQVFDLGTFYHYLGISYWMISDLENARINFEESLYFREKVGHYLDLRGTYNNLGSVYSQLNNHNKMLLLYDKAIGLIYDFGRKIEALDTFHSLSNYYGSIGNFEKALDFSSQALEISIEEGTSSQVSISLLYLGLSYQNLKMPTKSLETFNKALQHCKTDNLKSKLLMFSIFLNIKLGNLDKAEKLLVDLNNVTLAISTPHFKLLYDISEIQYNLARKNNIELKNLNNVVIDILSMELSNSILYYILLSILNSKIWIEPTISNSINKLFSKLNMEDSFVKLAYSVYSATKAKIEKTEEIKEYIIALENNKEFNFDYLEDDISSFIENINSEIDIVVTNAEIIFSKMLNREEFLLVTSF